ncbi:TetR/AcrR family transcriptional regulator [Nocardiopsis sediminis]|uniref:TetR/AcrR family transcriptional regulator n=1 Tax=Nocardiopsis sediminis TaxID=1778267 RepID=A0ABV8FL99_9ACTN
MAARNSGGGDPARGLALLWRAREPQPAGRSSLTADRIVHAAIAIADTEGLAALSMRRVAESLGVGTMSLYTYVPGKSELTDAMLDTVYGEALDDAPETAQAQDGHDAPETAQAQHGHDAGGVSGTPGDGDGWRSRLERIARGNRALHLRHPWMVQVATGRPVLGPNETAKYDRELRAVDGIGLTEVEMDSVIGLITGYVHGAVRGEVESARAERQSGVSDAEWWSARAPVLSHLMDPGRYPTAARVGRAAAERHGAAHDPDHDFEFGLQRVLDGIDAFIRGRTGTDPGA